MQRPTTLIVFGSLCLWLLAGCASPGLTDGQHRGAGANFAATNHFRAEGPFADYDSVIYALVTKQWYDLLDSSRFALDRKGKVVMQFRLHQDGTVSKIKISQNDVGATLGYVCTVAIEKCAPFAPWPPDMRVKIGMDYRDINFTFNYF